MYSSLPEWNAVSAALNPYYPDNRGYDYPIYDDDGAGEGRQTVVQVQFIFLCISTISTRRLRNQLTSTNTNFNTTLNLTGHILLGLGIATSLLLVMFLEAYDQEAFGRKRRKVSEARVSFTHAKEELTINCARRGRLAARRCC